MRHKLPISIVLGFLLAVAGLFPASLHAQSATALVKDIVVVTNMESNLSIEGTKTLIRNMCGITIGGGVSQENIANSIRTLWGLGFFSDIRVHQEPMSGGIRIIYDVDLLPVVNTITLEGFKEYRDDEILAATGLIKGKAIGPQQIAKMRSAIFDLYKEKGFLAAVIDFTTTPVLSDSTKVDVTVNIKEGKKVKIKTITLSGNEAIGDKEIRKQMKNTKEDRWYRAGEYKEELYDQDKKTIVALYKSKGYRDMEIAGDSTWIDPETEKLNLTIFIREGAQYRFGKTSFDGNTHFAEEQLRTTLRYKEGEVFNEQELMLSIMGYPDQEIVGIQSLYNDDGYLTTAVNPIQSVRGDSIDIFIDIAEGSISRVAQVIVEGNTKTIEKVIRREINIDPGDTFNRTKLERSRRDIMALNFFQDVQYDYEHAGEGDDVNLKFKVAERQTGMASMGAGYSERDKLVGTLAFTNENLLGRGQSLNLSWDMGARRKAFQIGFGEPWLFDTPTSLSFDVYNIVRSDYTTAFDEEKRKGASIRLGRRLDRWIDYSRVYLTYRLEDVDYSNASDYYSYYLVTGKTSSLSLMFTRDSRDLPQFSTDGGRTSATVEIAGGPLGGDLSYYKYLLNNEMYTPLFWKLSLLLRTRIGFLKGYKESAYVPYSERFMPGGTSWDGFVRGYPNRQVCPRLDGEEIGGETMLVNNLELQIPVVAQTLYGIVFYDFGNAWRNLSETNPFDTKRSVGVGARVFVPGIGNIGFDVGYGFDRIESTDRIGGWRTHFQFGQTF